ncbi:MAG: hypothetical protein HN348_33625, partial [Proteobacteria bacterium]|nr:hypothetical protein [Pseudomonadota bacterium]
MLRLTLLSNRDGRFLARIIDRDGFAFVLDFGDRRVIDDATQRILHGFTMWRYGKLVSAVPQTPELVLTLADYYAREGLLVFLDEPMWSGRPTQQRADPWSGQVREVPEHSDEAEDLGDVDDDTELVNYADREITLPPARGAIREQWQPPKTEEMEPQQTELKTVASQHLPLDAHRIGDMDDPDDLTTEESPSVPPND